jgi:hypothetical protein
VIHSEHQGSSITSTVGIAGIIGKFAKKLVSYILKCSDVATRGYCRNPSKVSDAITSSSRVTLIKSNALEHNAIHTFVNICDVVVCCYPGDDNLMAKGQKALMDG